MRLALRRARRPARRDADFLPAVVEIIETPPSPAGRAMLWSIVALTAIVLAWSWFGWVDVVAVARGAVLPSGRVKLVQPLQPGTVAAIHVRDGDAVRAGDLLLELDSTAARAEADARRRAVASGELEAARLRAVLAAVAPGAPENPVTAFRSPADAEPLPLAEARAHLDFQVRSLRARIAGLSEQAEKARAAQAATQAEIARLEQTLPLAAQITEARDLLAGRGLGSRLEALQERQRWIGQAQELVAARARSQQDAREVAILRQRAIEALEEFRRDAAGQLATVQARLDGEVEEWAKARQRLRETRLLAPADGVVEGLAVHTIGGVVTAAQSVMSVVPVGERLEIEARIPDRDAAFLRVGQVAVVKLDAFPFTRHGTLEGRVSGVARDAIHDEHQGLLYSVRVTLPPGAARRDGAPVPRAGMGVNVEVWTGRRRLAEYLISPLEQRAAEAFRER